MSFDMRIEKGRRRACWMARQTRTRRPGASGGNSPCTCKTIQRNFRRRLISSSSLAFTNTPTDRTPAGTDSAISRARAKSIIARTLGIEIKPNAFAPACAAARASSYVRDAANLMRNGRFEFSHARVEKRAQCRVGSGAFISDSPIRNP